MTRKRATSILREKPLKDAFIVQLTVEQLISILKEEFPILTKPVVKKEQVWIYIGHEMGIPHTVVDVEYAMKLFSMKGEKKERK